MPRTIETQIRGDQNRWSGFVDRVRRFSRAWRRPAWKAAFETPQQLETALQRFYLQPRPDAVGYFFEFLDSGNHLSDALGTLGFLTEFLAAHPERRDELAGISAAGSSLLKGLFKTAESLVPRIGEGALKLDEHTTVANDFYWSAFYASGKLGYVDILIEECMLGGSLEPGPFEVGATAQWSLAANVRQHELVERHVRQRRDELAGRRSVLLTEALETDPAELLARHAADLEALQTSRRL